MQRLALAIATLLALMCTACGLFGRGEQGVVIDEPPAGGDTLTHRARLLTIVDHGNYVVADVADPWKSGRLARYILINRDRPRPDTLPRGTVVEVPLRSSVVYSAVHASAIEELGRLDAVTGTADGDYATANLKRHIAGGRITDVGSSMAPSLERIINLDPDALLVSPFENAGHGAIENIGIPVIECADYMEQSPLARAEWILLLGELYGARQEARQIYARVADEYTALRDSISSIPGPRPKVITETMQQGVWFVPGGRSYMARLISDAGGDYPWASDKSSGSLQLDFGAVYDRAHDADIWLMRTYGYDQTLSSLRSDNSLNARFKAFNNGVWSCNTAVAPLFDDLPFHPERVLMEFARIFHPEVFSSPTVYYHKVK